MDVMASFNDDEDTEDNDSDNDEDGDDMGKMTGGWSWYEVWVTLPTSQGDRGEEEIVFWGLGSRN